MYRLIILILLFWTFLTPVSVLAEWDWQNAEPQALNVKGRIITSEGSEIAPNKGITQFEITLPEELVRGQALAFIQRAFVYKGVQLSKKVTVVPQINGKRWLITDL